MEFLALRAPRRGNGQRSKRTRGRAALVLAPILSAIVLAAVPAGAVEPTAGVVAWGSNAEGQLGNGTTVNSDAPVGGSGLSGVTAVAAGANHSLALLSNGTVMAWGENGNGQLGNGTTTNRDVPVAVSGLSGVTAIAAGGKHSMALLSNGTVMTWGENSHGQLGNGTINDSNVPVAVSGLSGVTAIAAGAQHSLALLSNGTVMAWGDDVSGQVGNGVFTRGEVTPVAVSGLSGVTAIAAGSTHSLAVLSGGTAMAWGDNANGQLGNGTTTNSDVPVAVSGLSGVAALSGGGHHSLALLSGGTAMAWGNNENGQLGNGTTTNSDVPVAVSGLSGATALAAGGHHSLALLSGGTVMAWGRGALGQLGTGSTSNSNVPVAISTVNSVKGIAGGESFSLAFGPQLAAITSVAPNSGPPAGGTEVTISGSNFTEATAVHFGASSAASFKVNSATSITATSPMGTGVVDVTVTVPSGTSGPTPADRFSYGPTVTSVNPNAGPQAGGTEVTIEGTNFAGVTAVKFGANNASTFKVNSTTSITATSPLGAGVVDVTVTGSGGTSATSSADRFSYTGVPPEFGRCVKVPSGTGKYATGVCTSTATGGSFEWEPGVKAGKTGFLSKAGEVKLATVGKLKIICTTESGTGEYTGPKTEGHVHINLHGCLLEGGTCRSAGAGAGEVKTNELEGALEWQKKAESSVALDLFPVGNTGLIAKFACGAATLELRGSVLVHAVSDRMQSKPTLIYAGLGGLQKPTEYETPEGAKVKDFLELSPAEEKFEQAGLSMKETISNKEPIEINTVV